MIDFEAELARDHAGGRFEGDLPPRQALRHFRCAARQDAGAPMKSQCARAAKNWAWRAVFSRVDTCAAEFESFTPYLYSNYESACEADPGTGKKVMILGSGPNRIGQGIEFDYCCCHASFALQEMGVESIMVNCNPETVSTDYDTSDRLYFEPLTLENVLNICDTEKPDGVIVQFGGQTPLNLALPLKRLGVPIIGTDPANIDLAEDRKLFGKLLDDLAIPCPANGTATSAEEACDVARRIGYPVLVRPSYVLGGRAMVIAYDEEMVRQYMREAVTFSQERPVLVDRFLENATEVDVDALADGDGDVLIAGIMEHIEEAGVHSGDSSCVLPAQSLPEADAADHRRLHRAAGQGAARHRADERAVRDPERRGLRAGSEPARLAHGAVCQQGHRRGAAQDRGGLDVGHEAGGLRTMQPASSPRRRRS